MPDKTLLLDASLELFDAALAGDTALAAAAGAVIAEGWLDFPEALPVARHAYAELGDPAPWGTLFFLLETPRTLIGWGGFKGAPDVSGCAEIGYAIAPGFRGRGLATAVARHMVARAFSDPRVRAVTAQTLEGPNPSTAVLERLGFSRDGEAFDPDVGAVWACA